MFIQSIVVGWRTQLQVYHDKSDEPVANSLSGSSRSELNETIKKKRKKEEVVESKQERWLAPFAFSRLMHPTGNPRLPCFVCWYKYPLTSKVARVRFVPTPHTYASLNSSDRRPSGIKQVSDSLWDSDFFAGVWWRYISRPPGD